LLFQDYKTELHSCQSQLSLAQANGTATVLLLEVALQNATMAFKSMKALAQEADHRGRITILFWALAIYSAVNLGVSVARTVWYLEKKTTRILAQRNPHVFPLDW